MATISIPATRPLPRPPVLPAMALLVCVAFIAAGIVAYWRGWDVHAPIGYGADLPALLSTELFAAVSAAVGSVVARRRPRCLIAWLLILLGLAAAGVAFGLYGTAVAPTSRMTATLDLGGWLAGSGMQPLMGGLTGLLMFVFPDGRLASRAWRPAVAILLSGATLRFAEIGLAGAPVPYLPTLENPYRLPDPLGAALAWTADLDLGLWLLLLGMALGALSLVSRYRVAGPEARQQIRWFVFAGTLVVATLAPLAHLFVFVDPALGRGQDLWVLFFASASLFPIAVGTAILRYRLYDIDRIISRTFVYGALTAILAGVFTASIALSQRLFVAATGETSDVAIVLTTLVAAASYTPIRRRLEAFAERLFRYEEPRFGAYRQQLSDLLALLDPEAAARRLVDEATATLRASDGWVDLTADPAACSPDGANAAERPTRGPGAVSVEIPGRFGPHGRLVLGPRLDGTPYRPAEERTLQEMARLVGRALDLRPSGGVTAGRRVRGARRAAARGSRSGAPAREAGRAGGSRRVPAPAGRSAWAAQAPAASVPHPAMATP